MTRLFPVVAAALIDADGRVLVQQRPAGKPMAGLWEFPGGKLEEGETPEAALMRELREELGIETEAACLAPAVFASAAMDEIRKLRGAHFDPAVVDAFEQLYDAGVLRMLDAGMREGGSAFDLAA